MQSSVTGPDVCWNLYRRWRENGVRSTCSFSHNADFWSKQTPSSFTRDCSPSTPIRHQHEQQRFSSLHASTRQRECFSARLEIGQERLGECSRLGITVTTHHQWLVWSMTVLLDCVSHSILVVFAFISRLDYVHSVCWLFCRPNALALPKLAMTRQKSSTICT